MRKEVVYNGRMNLRDYPQPIDGDQETPAETYLPRVEFGTHITHYYGDYVRKSFVAVAAILVIFLPLLGRGAIVLLPVQIIGVIVLIVLAALTSPKNKRIMMGNAAASVLGIIVFEVVAIAAFLRTDMWQFYAFEALALVFLSSLYFSLKTIRAMEMGIVGKRDLPGEFMQEKYHDAQAEK